MKDKAFRWNPIIAALSLATGYQPVYRIGGTTYA